MSRNEYFTESISDLNPSNGLMIAFTRCIAQVALWFFTWAQDLFLNSVESQSKLRIGWDGFNLTDKYFAVGLSPSISL